MQLYFVTGNKGKFEEVKNLIEKLTDWKIELLQISLDIPELDSQDLIAISQDKAKKAFKKLKKPLIVDDSGIYFDEYNDFPGPLAKRVFKGLWFKWLERLLKDADNKNWKFVTVVSYIDEDISEPISFVWQLDWVYDFSLIKIASEEQLQKYASLPYKYIFKPEGFDKFYSQLTPEESQQVSQRAKAIKKFVEWWNNNNRFKW